MGMTGAYERNLDAKGRLSLPAPLREELGEHVRVFKALDVDALYVFSAEAFDKWVEGLFAGREGHEGFNPRDINDQKLMRAINKRTTSMDVDSAGRIGLSESLRKQANLDREVTVVGNYDHLEVWDRATADEDDDEAPEEPDDGPARYEVTCPACGATSVVDEEALLDGEPVCPACGKPLDFEVTEE